MAYKVIYHCSASIGLSTRALDGILVVDQGVLTIAGDQQISIRIDSITSVKLFRLHGTARMIKIIHAGGTLFVSVIRFSVIRGYFAVINFFATGRLCRELEAAVRQGPPCGPAV